MMEINTIVEEIKKYIEENIISGDVKLTPATNLQNAGIDSFSTVEIILFIERKYGVVIPDHKMSPDNFRTLEALSKTVHELIP